MILVSFMKSLELLFNEKNIFICLFLLFSLGTALIIFPIVSSNYAFANEIAEDINSVKIDYRCYLSGPYDETISNIENILSEINSIKYVENSEAILEVTFVNAYINSSTSSTENYPELSYWFKIYGLPSSPHLRELRIIKGSFELGPNEIAIGYGLASLLGIDVGDNLTISYPASGYYKRGFNLTVGAIVAVERDLWNIMIYGNEEMELPSYNTLSRYNPNYALLGSLNLIHNLFKAIENRVSESEIWEILYIYVFLDHNKIIDPPVFSSIDKKLNEIYHSLYSITNNLSEYNFVDSYLSSKVSLIYWRYNQNSWSSIAYTLFLLSLITVIAFYIAPEKVRKIMFSRESERKANYFSILFLGASSGLFSLLIDYSLLSLYYNNYYFLHPITYSISSIFFIYLLYYITYSIVIGLLYVSSFYCILWLVSRIMIGDKITTSSPGYRIVFLVSLISLVDIAFGFPFYRFLWILIAIFFGFFALLLFPLFAALILFEINIGSEDGRSFLITSV